MKKLTLIILTLLAGTGMAQTKLNKTIAVAAGQNVKMRFDYPKLVKVSTWDKNEISIQGSVSINEGENDDAFTIESSTTGTTVSIRNEIKNFESLPHRYTVTRAGQKMVFRNQAEWEKYQNEHGRGHTMMSNGVDLEIELEIKVPRNMETAIESVYGIVEIKDFIGPLKVLATYGGVDASVTEQATGELIAETNYGHIYSNLSVKFGENDSRNEDFHTYVSVKPGTGPRYSFESTYGNVYLRKGQ